MFLKKKKRILESIDTICEVIEHIYNSGDVKMLNDIESAITLILEQIKKEDYDIVETINYIESTLNFVNELKAKGNDVTFDELNDLLGQVSIFEQAFLMQVKVKLNVVFMPYNITMWDSLESIYLACMEDEDCVAKVVPIPFFDITQDPPVEQYHLEHYDKSIGAIDYREFNLAEEEPDIIYVHNIYDYSNALTTVLPDFYTENLKKYTDMLVYSTYCIPSFIQKYMTNNDSYTFEFLGAANVDRFVSAGDFVLKEGLELNIPREKILNLGSPKFDYLIKNIEKEVDYPKEWIDKSKGKRVAIFSTSLNYFVKRNDEKENRVTNFCYTLSEFMRVIQKFQDEDILIIWRPHPLTRLYISRLLPDFVKWYDNLCDKIKGINLRNEEKNYYTNIVLDENDSIIPAFKLSDAFITNYTSIMFPYLMLNKKLIQTDDAKLYKKEFDVDKYKNQMGFITNDKGVKCIDEYINFEKVDRLEINTELLSHFYKNLDGTAGEKIHKAIKNDILNDVECKQ